MSSGNTSTGISSIVALQSPAVFELNEILASAGLKVGYMSEYFLPDVSKMQAFLPVDDKFELRRLGQANFASLYLPQWSHALCSERKELDILGMAAYDLNTCDKTTGEPKLIGLAACSMDCEDMWQIGIDILPEYRGLKLTALTSRLSGEIFKCGKIPFYCASWANIRVRQKCCRKRVPPGVDGAFNFADTRNRLKAVILFNN